MQNAPAAARSEVKFVFTRGILTGVAAVSARDPDVIPLEACYLGWQESLRNLSRLVEPEIKDAL
jgi:hypothetical protein